jgi:DNA-binding PadR family transcriptional regulator
MPRPSLSYAATAVLQAVANGHQHGFDVIAVTGLASGTVYPALRRLEEAGWLESRWEEIRGATGRAAPVTSPSLAGSRSRQRWSGTAHSPAPVVRRTARFDRRGPEGGDDHDSQARTAAAPVDHPRR